MSSLASDMRQVAAGEYIIQQNVCFAWRNYSTPIRKIGNINFPNHILPSLLGHENAILHAFSPERDGNQPALQEIVPFGHSAFSRCFHTLRVFHRKQLQIYAAATHEYNPHARAESSHRSAIQAAASRDLSLE
jgi:hypothetical protein